MTHGILLALAAVLVYGFLAVSYDIAAKRHYQIWDVIFYMQFTGLLIGLAVTVFLRLPFYDLRLLGMGLLGAVTFVGSLACYLQASRQRDIAANWTIANLSVVIPILVSVWWFKDAFSWAKGLGVIFTLASIIVIGGGFPGTSGAGRASRSCWLVYISLSSFLNAWLVVLLRFVPAGRGPLFTAYLYGIGFLLVLGYKLAGDRHWPGGVALMGISAAAAVSHWSGLMLTMAALVAAGRVSSQAGLVVYPITNGLIIPVAVVLGALLLKQKISLRSGTGVVLGMVAMALLSFS
jgi:drug/metabolite transporter (DMT)-like permease